MNLGIIRCMQTEAYCPGSRDFSDDPREKRCFPPAYGKIDFKEKCQMVPNHFPHAHGQTIE